MHATVLKHHKTNRRLPCIRVTIVAGENEVGLRISDQGELAVLHFLAHTNDYVQAAG